MKDKEDLLTVKENELARERSKLRDNEKKILIFSKIFPQQDEAKVYVAYYSAK